MGILLTPAHSLFNIFQDGHTIEEYVVKFLELSAGVSWSDDVFKSVFWLGLDDHLYKQAPAAAFPGTFAGYLDHVLWLSGSVFTIG